MNGKTTGDRVGLDTRGAGRSGGIAWKCAMQFAAATMIAVLAACGSGTTEAPPAGNSQGSQNSQSPALVIQGKVVDASVAGAKVSAYTVTSSGTPGTLLAGPVTTAADGSYSLNLGSYSGPVILVATGGTYTDPATGATVNLANSGLSLEAIVPDAAALSSGAAVPAQITPLTLMAAQMEQTLLQNTPGANIASTAAAMNSQVAQFFGQTDLLTTALVDLTQPGCTAGASQAGIDESFILAGLAQLAKNAGVGEPALLQALASDASDGIFNGYNGKTALSVPLLSGAASVPLSYIENGSATQGNPGGLSALNAAISEFEASAANSCQAGTSSALAALGNPPAPLGAYGSFPLYLTVTLPSPNIAALSITFNSASTPVFVEQTKPLYQGETTVQIPWPIGPWEMGPDGEVPSPNWSVNVIAPSTETCSVTPSSGTFVPEGLGISGMNTSSTPLAVSCTGAAAPVTQVAVIPANPNALLVGQVQQFRALATLSGGAVQDITSSVNWASSNPTALAFQTTGSPGLATALAPSATPVTISATDPTSSFKGTATASVVAGSSLASLWVAPWAASSPSVVVGQSQQFTAWGLFSDGSNQNLTSLSTWSSGSSAVSIVASGTNAGLATGNAIASTPVTITASYTLNSTTTTGTSELSVAPLPPPSCYSAGSGGGSAPYLNQSYCGSFSGMTDMLYNFTGGVAFTTTSNGQIGKCQFWSSGTVSAGGGSASTQTLCTGTINTTTSLICGANTYSPPNFMLEDTSTNEFCGTFSTDGKTISGTYSFGAFGPGGGVASGSFTGSLQ